MTTRSNQKEHPAMIIGTMTDNRVRCGTCGCRVDPDTHPEGSQECTELLMEREARAEARRQEWNQ